MMMPCLSEPVRLRADGYAAPQYALCVYLASHYEELLRHLSLRLGCRDRAADALHDTWLRLRENRQIAPVDNPRGYLLRMAQNLAVDGIRLDTQYSAIHWGADAAELPEAVDPEPTHEDRLVMRALLRRLIEAIERLPRQRRAIFVAARLEDLSQQEVADRYGVSVRKVRNELRKAHVHCEQVLFSA